MDTQELYERIKAFNQEEYELRQSPENNTAFPDSPRSQAMQEFFERKDKFIDEFIAEYNRGGDLYREFLYSSNLADAIRYYDNDMVNSAYDKIEIKVRDQTLSFMPTVISDVIALEKFLRDGCNFYSRIDNEYPPMDDEGDFEYDTTELDHFPTKEELIEAGEELRERKFHDLFYSMQLGEPHLERLDNDVYETVTKIEKEFERLVSLGAGGERPSWDIYGMANEDNLTEEEFNALESENSERERGLDAGFYICRHILHDRYEEFFQKLKSADTIEDADKSFKSFSENILSDIQNVVRFDDDEILSAYLHVFEDVPDEDIYVSENEERVGHFPRSIREQIGSLEGRSRVAEECLWIASKKLTDLEHNLFPNKMLNLSELAEKIGNQPQEVTLPNGTTRMSVNWDGPTAQKALAEAYPLSMKGDKVVIDGPAPAWFASALTHVVHPCPVALHDPKVGDIDIPNLSLSRGEANPAGEIAFNVKEGEHGVLLTWSIDNGTMPPVYDHNNLSKIVVPDIPEGKPLFIDGRGPNYITVALGEAYAHTQPSVSYHQPQNKAYVCGITHDRTIQVGVMTPDDRVNELIKSRDEMTKEEVLKAIFGEYFAPQYSPDEKARFDVEYKSYLEKMVEFNKEEWALLHEHGTHDPEMDAFYERKNDFAAEFINFINENNKMPVTTDMIYLTEYGNNTTYYDKLKINLNEVGAQEEFTILPIVVAERDVDLLKFYMDRGIDYCDSYDIRFEPSPYNGRDLEEVSVNEGKAMGNFVFPPNCLVYNFEHAYETPDIDRQQHARELIGYFLGDNDVCNSDRLFFSPDYGNRWIEQFKNSDSFREVLQSAASDLSRVDLQTLRDHEVEKNGVMSHFPWQYISEDIYKDMIRDSRSEVEECRMEYIRSTARFENNPDLEDKLKENLDDALYGAPEEILNDKALMIGCLEIDGSLIHRVSEELQKDKDVIRAAIRENAENIAYIKDQTPEMCMDAVRQDWRALEYVRDQTPEICMAAVKQSGMALQYVKEQAHEICLAAVKQEGVALFYVQEQTPEICMAAVEQDGVTLHFVENQTPEICMAAVKQDYRAFEYVLEPTPEIAAVACRGGAEDGLSIEEVLNLNYHHIKLSDKDLEIIRSGGPEQTVDESPEEKTKKDSDDRFDIGSKLENMTKKAEDNKGEGQGESQGESQGETPTDR